MIRDMVRKLVLLQGVGVVCCLGFLWVSLRSVFLFESVLVSCGLKGFSTIGHILSLNLLDFSRYHFNLYPVVLPIST